MALGVGRQQRAGVVERRLLADAGEHVGEIDAAGARVAYVVRGDQRQPVRARDGDGGAVAPLLGGVVVARDLEVQIAAAEDAAQAIELEQAVGEREQPRRVGLELGEGDQRFAFISSRFRIRYEAT